ncbi:MAG TPA: hypothetical protein VK515_04600, partial [Rhizomicrobium sp.]|nr:hypothetical protein [Rhizomicrobium sp.]
MRGYILVLMLGLLPPAAMAVDEVVVLPQKSAGEIAHYPRLVKFPDPQARDRVNEIFAHYDHKQSDDRRDCLQQLREQHLQKDKDSFYTSIEVTYVSRRFLSLSVNGNYYCGGPYPVNGATAPVTVDLTQGAEVDWKKMFKPGFLSGADAKTGETRLGKLAGLYRTRYAKIRKDKDDQECRDAIGSEGFLDVNLRLDRAQGGLVIEPQ